MNSITKLYNFLGGIRFALILIATVAALVIAGTVIESYTQSHRYAANLTYGNPFFALLLWGFFINILFSATRRWPFQVRHIPFLITHLGLLMILAGALTKNYFGVQGNMGIMEGSASHEIFETDTYALQMESKKSGIKRYPLKRSLFDGFASQIVDGNEGLHVALADYTPHSIEHFHSWVKDGHASVAGLPPVPLSELTDDRELELLPSTPVTLETTDNTWQFYAIKAHDAAQTMNALFGKHGKIRLTDTASGELIAELPLKEVMQQHVEYANSQGASFKIHLSHLSSQQSTENILSPFFEISLKQENLPPLKMRVPLDGSQALLNLNQTTPYLGSLPLTVDLICEPTLAVIEDDNEDVCVAAFDGCGCFWSEFFSQGRIQVMYVYDDGYAGYTMRAEPSFSKAPIDRKFRENLITGYIKAQMQQAMTENKELSPPLELLRQTCDRLGADFTSTCLDFLTLWHRQNSWLFALKTPIPGNLAAVFENITWDSLTLHDKKALLWTSHLFKRIGNELESGKDVVKLLQEQEWPMVSTLEPTEHELAEGGLDRPTHILTQLTQQMHTLADIMAPPADVSIFDTGTAAQNAHLFSAYMRAFAIHLHTITPSFTTKEMQSLLAASGVDTQDQPLVFETSLIPSHRAQYPTKKLEENLPAITIKAYKKGVFQAVSLAYSRFGKDLKWPILNGEYLVRFQPQFIEIPYRVRLRSARQINYANSSQPFSFESDVIITDRRTGHSVEKTISMNNVHETWDGYRFYLANIAPPTENAVKQVQLVINHDPAKYWLTYPGAIIMSAGIVLLFWMRPYRKK